MTEMRTVRKWFWAWEDEKEEQWLTEMALQGWHLKTSAVFGVYTFEKGAQADIVYRLDFKSAGKDMEEYLQLFTDGGWEYVGALGGWQYFRRERVDGEVTEIYTDNASKVQKYSRVMLFLVILLPTLIMPAINMSRLTDLDGFWAGFMGAMSVMSGLLMLLYIYAMIRILRRINELKK